MAAIEGGSSLALMGVGAEAASPGHVTLKAIPHGALGHYRVTHRCLLANAQAANSRLFEVRNTHATNLIIPTRFMIKWLQTGAHTAAIEDSLDIFKLTGFSAVDTTNTVTPVQSVKRTDSMAVVGSSIAAIRGVTAAGAAAGMTGGTLTKDTNAFAQLPQWLLAALPTAGTVIPQLLEALDDVNGTHPWAFKQNEGFEVENRVLLGAAAASAVYFDFSWAEVTVY